MNQALLLAGGNIEPRLQYLEVAERMLANESVFVKRSSGIYETSAWGFNSPTTFYNKAFVIETFLSPWKLLKHLKAIELEMGRELLKNSDSYSSRIIDLDILLYNKETIVSEGLLIPHPRMHERRFALVPAAEICPEWIHPIYKGTVQDLLNNCKDELSVIKI